MYLSLSHVITQNFHSICLPSHSTHLGILMYEFLFGNPPFFSEKEKDTYIRICNVDLKFPSQPAVSAEAKDLMKKLIVKDPNQRLQLKDLIYHPFMIKYRQYLPL